jgi:hypothetical protein
MYSTKASQNHHRREKNLTDGTLSCQDFIAAAKDGEWDQLREILGRHPGYAGLHGVDGAARRHVSKVSAMQSDEKNHRLD